MLLSLYKIYLWNKFCEPVPMGLGKYWHTDSIVYPCDGLYGSPQGPAGQMKDLISGNPSNIKNHTHLPQAPISCSSEIFVSSSHDTTVEFLNQPVYLVVYCKKWHVVACWDAESLYLVLCFEHLIV